MIHLQQSAPGELDSPVLSLEELFIIQSFVYRLELRPDVDAKLAAKVVWFNRAGLELQDHFADELLFRSQGQCSLERQLILIQQRQVFLKAVGILKMNAAEV